MSECKHITKSARVGAEHQNYYVFSLLKISSKLKTEPFFHFQSNVIVTGFSLILFVFFSLNSSAYNSDTSQVVNTFKLGSTSTCSSKSNVTQSP